MLLGIGGLIGAGKSAAANYLQHRYGFTVVSMADPLKRACQELFLFREEQLYGTQAQKEQIDPRWGCSPRTALQYVGTELLRNQLDQIMPGIGNDLFCRRFELWYQEQVRLHPNLCVVIPDIRFPNEIASIARLGGETLFLVREEVPTGSLHASETSVTHAQFDHCYHNSGTLDDLHRMIDDLIATRQEQIARSKRD